MAETDDERRAREIDEIHRYLARYEREDGRPARQGEMTGTRTLARGVRLKLQPPTGEGADPARPDKDMGR